MKLDNLITGADFFKKSLVLGWADYYLKFNEQERENRILEKPCWVSSINFFNDEGEVETITGMIMADQVYLIHEKKKYNPCIQIGNFFLKKNAYYFNINTINNQEIKEELKNIGDRIGYTEIPMKALTGNVNNDATDDQRLIGNLMNYSTSIIKLKPIAESVGVKIKYNKSCFPLKINN